MSQGSSIAQRLKEICLTLPDSVRLIAVTKQVGSEELRQAYQAGVRDFAENLVQEAEAKQAKLQDIPDITWHLIGHLQSNKAKKALELFTWIHSCDSLALAQRLDRLAGEMNKSPQICLQIKLLPDPNKYGWEEPDLWQDLPTLAECSNLQIQGLMTILPLGLTQEEIAHTFARLKELAAKVNHQGILSIQHLSMGMSQDYPLAVAAGATMIRLGTTIFGNSLPRGQVQGFPTNIA